MKLKKMSHTCQEMLKAVFRKNFSNLSLVMRLKYTTFKTYIIRGCWRKPKNTVVMVLFNVHGLFLLTSKSPKQ